MKDHTAYYQILQKMLERMKGKVLKSLENAPSGKMYCAMNNGKFPQYYLVQDEKEEGTGRQKRSYLRKSEYGLAQRHAQKEYDQKILKEIMRQEKVVKLILKENGIGLRNLIKVQAALPDAKRNIVHPYVLSDDAYLENWRRSLAPGRNTMPFQNEYVTEKGETVRSKSEKMIADKLYLKGIPYVYEAQLKLEGKGTIYPDFTILNLRTREEFYLEHFGMMDDPEYCKSALLKIEYYEENRIHLGEKLLVTFESSQKGINLKQIDSYIERYF